jgi:uncharacterized membrane protein
MIENAWWFLAVLLLMAALFPVLAERFQSRLFDVLPPIVLSYLAMTALAAAGLFASNEPITYAQKQVIDHALPALLILLMVPCDWKSVLALGPRTLLAFACATSTICLGVLCAFWLWRGMLPETGWLSFAGVAAGWIGGGANLTAVTQSLQASPEALGHALLTDAICYSMWVALLFGTVALAPSFNAWTKSAAIPLSPKLETSQTQSGNFAHVLLWLALTLMLGLLARELAPLLPSNAFLNQTSWSLLIATLLGVLMGVIGLRRLPGASSTGSALLALVVVTLASKGSFKDIDSAPFFILCGLTVLAIHLALMLALAKLFRFDLATIGVASLANIGGIASAPVLAAAHAPALAPVGVLLAMLGYLLGTGLGLLMASVLQGMV